MPAPKIRRSRLTTDQIAAVEQFYRASANRGRAAAPAAPAVPARPCYGDPATMTTARALVAAFPMLSPYIDPVRLAAIDPNRSGEHARHFSNVRFGSSASDIPALLDLAARVLSTVVPSAHANPLGFAALDPLTGLYYCNRRRHSTTQKISDTDRHDTAGRIAAALVASCDVLASRTAPRDISGRFGTSDFSRHAVNGLAPVVASMLAAVNAAANH